MKKSELFFNVVRVPLDFGMLLLAGILTYLLRTQIISAFRPVLFQFDLPFLKYFSLVALMAIVFIICYAISGLYVIRPRSSFLDEWLKVVIGSSAGIMAVIILIFVQQTLFNSRFLVLGAWLLAVVLVSLGRWVMRLIQKSLSMRHGFGTHHVVVVGAGNIAQKISSAIGLIPEQGYQIVATMDRHDTRALGRLLERHGFDEIILADPSYDRERTAQLVDFCNEHHRTFRFVPHLYETLAMHSSVDMLADLPLIELKRTPLDGWGRVFKRAVDISVASVGLVLLSPIFLLVAVVVKANSKGPVFVALKRMSQSHEFDLYKFRSMIDGAHDLNPQLRLVRNDRPESGPLWKLKDDPRVTPVGRVIRKFRIDELPQFWNVLKGDMSLVGPRPHQPDEIARYQKHQRKLLAIKAGATGMAQVSGSSDLPFEEEVALDSFYIEHWSLWLDLKIIFKTMFKMLYDHSAV